MGMYPAGNIIRVTPTVIAGTTEVDDVVFDSMEIPNAVPTRGGVSRLVGILMIDKDNEKHDLDLHFTSKQQNFGTAGSAASVSDSDLLAAKPLGSIDVDWSATQVNIGNITSMSYFAGHNRNANAMQLPMLLQADGGSTSVFFTAIAREEIAFDATDDLQFVFHIEYLG